jgi:hypothetical protein
VQGAGCRVQGARCWWRVPRLGAAGLVQRAGSSLAAAGCGAPRMEHVAPRTSTTVARRTGTSHRAPRQLVAPRASHLSNCRTPHRSHLSTAAVGLSGTPVATVCPMPRDKKDGPLDGSVSGTIGGGGRETGGPTERPKPPETPPVHPDDAAGGRLGPDGLGSSVPPDEFGPGPSDVD